MPRSENIDNFLTTQEVADEYGVPQHQVIRAIKQERLPARKVGWQWVVHKDDLPKVWPPPVSVSA